jgi:transposase
MMTQNKYILFLGRLIQSHDRKVYLIADNLSVHHGKKVRAWVEANKDRIELFFIPSYSPELNPDEYLNRDLKKNVHGKRAPRTQAELKENVLSFMRKLQKLPERVMKYFNSPKVEYCR